MTIHSIAKGLYVGDQAALQELEQQGITHVLSVVNYEVTPPEGICHWTVSLEDDPRANLLGQLPFAVTWLERALRQKGMRVLVHCHAGTSRSVAVVAALVMSAKGLTQDAALDLLAAKVPGAAPNPGFLEQLALWGDMGCQLEEGHPGYKRFLLEQVARQYEEEGWVDPTSFADLPSEQEELQQLTRYRCRKCRHVVATERNVIPAHAGVGHRRFHGQRWTPRAPAAAGADAAAGAAGLEATHSNGSTDLSAGAPAAAPAAVPPAHGGGVGGGDSSLFLEPMSWMEGAIVGAVQGKLYCSNCQARLGSFNWSGITSTSGTWFTPGFQVHVSKVDTLSPSAPAALARMRYPALLAERRAAAAAAEDDLLEDLGGLHLREAGGDAAGDTGDGGAIPGSSAQHSTVPPQPPAAAEAVDTSSHGTDASPSSPSRGSLKQQWPCPRSAWFQALLLDCDGVLVDTERASCEALRRSILEVTGVTIPGEFPGDYEEVFGMDVLGCVLHYKRKLGRQDWIDPEAIAAAVQAAKEGHYQQLTAAGIQAFPGAARLIQQASAAGLLVGVGSSGATAKIAHNLYSSSLAQLLDPRCIVSAAEVGRGKPAPDVYVEVLCRLNSTAAVDAAAAAAAGGGGGGGGGPAGGHCCSAAPLAASSGAGGSSSAAKAPRPVPASRSLVVEDSIHGLTAGRAAGAYTVGIANSLPAHMLAPHADLVISHLDELDPLVLVPSESWKQQQKQQQPQ